MGKTIFVGARKGGVGKTMTAELIGFTNAHADGERMLAVAVEKLNVRRHIPYLPFSGTAEKRLHKTGHEK